MNVGSRPAGAQYVLRWLAVSYYMRTVNLNFKMKYYRSDCRDRQALSEN